MKSLNVLGSDDWATVLGLLNRSGQLIGESKFGKEAPGRFAPELLALRDSWAQQKNTSEAGEKMTARPPAVGYGSRAGRCASPPR
jgi:hypothetical protein